MTKTNFRLLLVFSLILALIGGFFDVMLPSEVLVTVNDFINDVEPEPSKLELILTVVFGGIALIFLVVSFIGLWLFKSWARHLYMASFIGMVPIYFLSGLYVSSGIAQLSYDLSWLISGFLVAIMYFTPVKEFFVLQKV